MLKQFPDSKFPPVKSTEYHRITKDIAELWKNLNAQEKNSYIQKNEELKKRYHGELDEWKREMKKPENESKLKELEKLLHKMETREKVKKQNEKTKTTKESVKKV